MFTTIVKLEQSRESERDFRKTIFKKPKPMIYYPRKIYPKKMAKQKQTTHKPFSKPFWKLLGGSVLGLALVFGGMVWANYPGIQYCVENASLCVGLTPKGTSTETSEQETIDLSEYNNKRLKITNESDKAVFVPLKTKTELDSFLNAVQTPSDETGHNATMFEKFNICEVGLNTNKQNWKGTPFNWTEGSVYSDMGIEVAKNCSSYPITSWSQCQLTSGTPPNGDYYPAFPKIKNWCSFPNTDGVIGGGTCTASQYYLGVSAFGPNIKGCEQAFYAWACKKAGTSSCSGDYTITGGSCKGTTSSNCFVTNTIITMADHFTCRCIK